MNNSSVGLFLDFDGVITPKAVNLQFAEMLKIENDLLKLERDYADGVIDNDGFNKILIPLFEKNGFTLDFARENFSKIRLNDFAQDLITHSLPDIFIVSSSPSYYLYQFAQKFSIPKKNMICSVYEFSRNGKRLTCKKPCGFLDKADFVKTHVSQYAVSVGVGDSIHQDSRFMSLCSFQILMGNPHPTYLNASDLPTVHNLVRTARSLTVPQGQLDDQGPPECQLGTRALHAKSSYEQNVFIMTPFREDRRYIDAIKNIKTALEDHGLVGWTAADDDLDDDLWTNVKCFMHACKYGIALITAHEVESNGSTTYVPDVFNPNVMAEAGYMMAQRKKVLLLKDARVKNLPADWLGKLYTSVDIKSPDDKITKAINRWIVRAKRSS